MGEINSAFIRALVTAVTESSIEGEVFFFFVLRCEYFLIYIF